MDSYNYEYELIKFIKEIGLLLCLSVWIQIFIIIMRVQSNVIYS